jgi:hypothetical protein
MQRMMQVHLTSPSQTETLHYFKEQGLLCFLQTFQQPKVYIITAKWFDRITFSTNKAVALV